MVNQSSDFCRFNNRGIALWRAVIIALLGIAAGVIAYTVANDKVANPPPKPTSQVAEYALKGPVKEVTTYLFRSKAPHGYVTKPQGLWSDLVEIFRFDDKGRITYHREGDGGDDRYYRAVGREYNSKGELVQTNEAFNPWTTAVSIYSTYVDPDRTRVGLRSSATRLEATYNNKGRIITTYNYDAHSKLVVGAKHSYNEKGDLQQTNLVETNEYATDKGKMLTHIHTYEITYSYKYDSHGNWIWKKIVQQPGGSDPSSSRKPTESILERKISYYPSVAPANPIKDERIESGIKGPVRAYTGMGYGVKLFEMTYIFKSFAHTEYNRAGQILTRESILPNTKPEYANLKISNTYSPTGVLRSSSWIAGKGSNLTCEDAPDLDMILGTRLLSQVYESTSGWRYRSKLTKLDKDGRSASEMMTDSKGKVIASAECKRIGDSRDLIVKDASGKTVTHFTSRDSYDKYGNMTSANVKWLVEKGKPSKKEQNLSWKIEYWD